MNVVAPFSVEVERRGSECVVDLVGELDMATVPDLVATAQTLIEMGPNEIVFDFSRLSFIDGTGLAGMVELQERLGNQGRHLAVRSANGNARRLFEITELTEFLRVES